jgi:hypothetical protein
MASHRGRGGGGRGTRNPIQFGLTDCGCDCNCDCDSRHLNYVPRRAPSVTAQSALCLPCVCPAVPCPAVPSPTELWLPMLDLSGRMCALLRDTTLHSRLAGPSLAWAARRLVA